MIRNKTHLPFAYFQIAILSFLNFLFPIFKSSLFLHVFFTYYFQIVPCPGHGTWCVVPIGHTSINVATRMEHILYTLFQRSRERWAVTLELPLKSLGCVGPGGRSLCYSLDLSLSKLCSQISSSVAHLKYGETNSNSSPSCYPVFNKIMHMKVLCKR